MAPPGARARGVWNRSVRQAAILAEHPPTDWAKPETVG